jgi:16S rRNA C967 or C1407 C5-methylase (RsmB/RsmF family)
MEGAVSLQHIPADGIPSYPALVHWRKKEYTTEISKCLRILPKDIWDGFFIAKFERHS